LNAEELRKTIEGYGKPKVITVYEHRLASNAFLAKHSDKDDPAREIIGEEDIEIALAYSLSPEDLLKLSPQVYKSLVERYRAENLSLKQLEILENLSQRTGATGSSKSRASAKEPSKSE
jgi:hypothetical protein